MTRFGTMMSPIGGCGHLVRKSKPVELGKRKRQSILIDHEEEDDRDANPGAWVDTKRQRINMHEYVSDIAHMDDRDQYPTAPTYAAYRLDSGEWDEDDGELVDDRFYRNTDFWMVGTLSDKIEYSGALFSNNQFAIEQMELRLAQLELQGSETEEEVPEATQNGLLANVVSIIQQLASLQLPFFG